MGLGGDFRSCLATGLAGCQPASGFSLASHISCAVLPAQADLNCFSTGALWKMVPRAPASWPACEMSLVPCAGGQLGRDPAGMGLVSRWPEGPLWRCQGFIQQFLSPGWTLEKGTWGCASQRSPPVSLGRTPWGMGVVKTSTACLSPPVWREETPPSNLAPVFTSPHVPVPSSQLFIGHTSPSLEQEEPWEALYLVSPPWVWRTVGAQQTPAHIWEASFGESVGSTKVVMGFCSRDQ